ncbi:hypothetical protein Pelo_2465 [Pelomyxa schiedti]|nr:hypothetical protein Pelo_2465 [Pelomyxa schiedti]
MAQNEDADDLGTGWKPVHRGPVPDKIRVPPPRPNEPLFEDEPAAPPGSPLEVSGLLGKPTRTPAPAQPPAVGPATDAPTGLVTAEWSGRSDTRSDNGDTYCGEWVQGKRDGWGEQLSARTGNWFEGLWRADDQVIGTRWNFDKERGVVGVYEGERGHDEKKRFSQGWGVLREHVCTPEEKIAWQTWRENPPPAELSPPTASCAEPPYRVSRKDLVTVYEGNWEKGKKHGKGTYTDPKTGDTYVGNFVMDHKCGEGRMMFQDGGTYIGWWDRDKFHGKGVRLFADGQRQGGLWEHGRFLYPEADTPGLPGQEPLDTRSQDTTRFDPKSFCSHPAPKVASALTSSPPLPTTSTATGSPQPSTLAPLKITPPQHNTLPVIPATERHAAQLSLSPIFQRPPSTSTESIDSLGSGSFVLMKRLSIVAENHGEFCVNLTDATIPGLKSTIQQKLSLAANQEITKLEKDTQRHQRELLQSDKDIQRLESGARVYAQIH